AAQERSRRIQVRGDDTQTTTGGAAMTQAVGGGAASGSERAKSDAGSAGATMAGGGASPSSGQGASSPPAAAAARAMAYALGPDSPVFVVGAGIMGAGIAQVAAQAGHAVQLFDSREGAAAGACANLATTLDGLAAKGRLD